MISMSGSGNQVCIEGYQVKLAPVQQQDLSTLLRWRNSEFVRRQMVHSDLITPRDHQAWFTRLQSDVSQRHWVCCYKGKPVGVTNIKSVNAMTPVATAAWLEPGLYIGEPAYQGNILAFSPTLAMYDYCFDILGTKGFMAVVKAENAAALKYNAQLGYEVTKEDAWVTLTLSQEAYQAKTAPIKRLLNR